MESRSRLALTCFFVLASQKTCFLETVVPQAALHRLSHDHVIKEVDLQNSCTGYDSLGDLQIRLGRTRVA
jgi:hypothetical protein